MPVRDLIDGQDLDQVLLVREIQRRAKRDGAPFLKLVFADRTGALEAMVWDGVEEVASVCVAGRPIRVVGTCALHPRYGMQVTVRALRPAVAGSFDLADLCAGPARPVTRMEADLRELAATIRHPHLSALLRRIFGPDTPTWTRFRAAAAAKRVHQAYEHGLLEHTLTVAQAVSATSAIFPGIDRDLAVTGALLHDIGKLEAYTEDPLALDLTDDGKLLGEIPLGYFRVRSEIEAIDGFPPETAKALLHVILSHHGALEHGSPVVPCTREATLVHFMDNVGGRLGSFDRLEQELQPGQAWSGYDRALGGGAWFGAAAPEPVEESAAA